MNKADRDEMKMLAEKALEIAQEINALQNDLESRGRSRDSQRMCKAKDLIDEWANKWI